MSRSKALKLNMITSLSHELVVLITGLILPRLILVNYGSASNGLVSSVLQFLGFSAILRAGIGGATRAALYKPLAQHDELSINRIMSATNQHMKKVGAILGAGIIIFSLVYPFVVRDEYDWFYAFSMVIIIGSATFIDNFIGIKYKILLQADQKYYIQIGTTTISSVLCTITSVVLIYLGFSIHIVRLGITIVSLVNPLLLSIYSHKHYRINWKAEPDYSAINQRWNAFFHQVATIINQNIDIVLLTFFVSLKEVSVYTVHFMVTNNISKVANSCVTGINSTFGNIMANNEEKNLKTTFFFIEWLMMSICMILFSVTAVMLPGFISVYTKSVEDVNYVRPLLAVLMVIVAIINSIRIPYQMLVEAAGKFKETRNGALLEVVLNIVISVILIYNHGIVGVIVGTFIAGGIRTAEYAVFCMRKILNINYSHIIKHFLLLAGTFALCYIVGDKLILIKITNYASWVSNAVIVTIACAVITLIISLVFYKEQVNYLLARLLRKVKKGERYDKKNIS